MNTPEHQKSATLTANDRAPSAARSFTRDALKAWDLKDLLDQTVLIVSELTTNAERHGRSEVRSGTADENNEHITLTLAFQAGVLGIEVEDNSSQPPITQVPYAYETSGRGLHLVSYMADFWTAVPTEDGSGKRVLAFVKRPDSDPMP